MTASILALLGVLIVAVLAHQWWLARRIEEQNNDWLDAVKGISEELERMRAKTAERGSNDE